MLDDVDKILISELQKDGRKPLSQIAKKLGVSHVAVRKRLKNLLDKGFISVTANLNLEALNAKAATVTVEVENYIRLKELMGMFKDCPRTVFLAPLTGSNLITVIVGEDSSTLENVIGVCSVRAQKGIRRSEVYVGNLPAYPKYLPIRIAGRHVSQTAPCGARCDRCESFKTEECVGCPSTKFYNGPL